jgi:hypothetical protein
MLPQLVDLPSLLNARLASIALTSAQMNSMPFATISLLLSPWHSDAVPTCNQLYHREPQSRSLGTNHEKQPEMNASRVIQACFSRVL